MKHTISALVEDESGVLTRIAGLFARRGFNIDSLAVGPTEQTSISRITMVIPGDDKTIDQLTKQLYKLVNVLYVEDITNRPCVERELMLLKIKVPEARRLEIMGIVDTFRGKIINMSETNVIIEVTGDSSKVIAFEEILKPFGIIEIARTGKIALVR